jgi:hypothetical protein
MAGKFAILRLGISPYYPLRALPPYDIYLDDIYLPLPFYTTYLRNISHESQPSTIIL